MNQQLCDTNRLSSFVRGELSDEVERELTAHLDKCETCGQALEQQVAEASAWQEASVFLGERSLPVPEADFSVTQSRDAQIEHVVSQLLPTDDPDSLGRIGAYEVTGVVGSGGMGVVLKAHDHSLDRVVAVKVMAPHLAASGSARQRFAREAKAAAAVLHPNVIAIHGVSNEQALPYLVMPYVRGQSLQKRIDAEGPLPLVDILRIGSQVAAGLAAAHEQGLVHRDIKPGNILMEQGVERVTITDFGLARAVDDASMTRSGVIAGTPQYMSPEQARGEPIDARSDLFSLGCLLYAMCTGHSPFRAETSYGVMHRIMQDSPRPITEINSESPAWLEDIVRKLLSKAAGDRFETAGEVAELLEGCLSHTQNPITTPLPKPITELAAKSSRHRRWAKYIAAGVLLPLFLLAGVLIRLELNKGTLRIESYVDDVPIRILQGTEVVEELTVSKSGGSVRIAAGKYEVEIGGPIDGIAVDDGSVTLERGGSDIVRIVKVAPVKSALGDRPYGRLMKDLQAIKPPGGVPVSPSGAPISVAMGNELTRRLETVPDGELDKWVDQLERVTGDKLDGEIARQACRTYIVNRMSVLFDEGDWNPTTASRLFKELQSLTPSEVEAWKDAFESLIKETIGQNDREVFDGGPSYAVPLVLISVDALFDDEIDELSSGTNNLSLASGLTPASITQDLAVKYRKRLAQLSKDYIASWRSKVDRFGGTKIDAAMNIILLDDYFADETFQDGDFAATLGGTNALSLATAIEKFNSLHQWDDQTPLTEDEVVACISWVLHHEEPPESELRLDLRLLTEQRQLPQGWGISALESSPTIGKDVASQWTINLESVTEDRVIPIRQWAVSPPESLLEPTEQLADESGMPLQAAINAFNASRRTINGIRQPPLTLKEVLAAISLWKNKRNDAGVDDATFENFQKIARTHYLPADTRFQMIPRFETSSGVYSIWSVSIVMPQVSKPEWTYAFSIRHQFIALNAELASQIHWGKPAENGLQAGFRLIPAQEAYRVGQMVDTEFFYRSIYGQAPVSLPNAFTYKRAHLRRSRTNDELEVIEDQQEKIVGGWISAGVTEEPISRKGRQIEFSDDPNADFKTNVGTKLIVSPTDGNLSLSFTVANPADGAEGESLRTGEVHFRVVADELLPANREAAGGTGVTALPDQVESTDGKSPRQETVSNLTRIINALHRYHELHGRFPPATILGKDGKGGPPHSWRVELLPLLGYGGLYDRYNFKAAWDSQRNLAVLAQMPDVYRSPLDQGNSTNTSYFGVVSDDISKRSAHLQEMRDQQAEADESAYIGDSAVQPEYEQYTPEATVFWKQRGASFRDMLDGTSYCIAVIEAKRDVPWTKPEDIEYSADQPLPKFGGWFEQGVHAAFADGTVKFLANYNDDETIQNLLTISDGQPVEPLLVRRLRIHGAVAVSEDGPEVTVGPEIYRVPDGLLLRVLPDQRSIITEADIAEVAVTTNPNNPSAGDIVAMTLTEEAGKRFLKATSRLSEHNLNGYMLITLDRKVLIAPRVLSPIAKKLTITGDIDAKALAEEIQAAMKDLELGETSPPVMGMETLAPVEEVSQLNDEDGSFVTVTLPLKWHSEAALKQHLGQRHLTLLAEGVVMDDERSNAVNRVQRSVLHDCRLVSYKLIKRDGVEYWQSRLFVPHNAEYSIGALWYSDPIRTLRIGDRHTPVPADTLTQDDPQATLDKELQNGFQLRLDDSTDGKPGLSFDAASAERASAGGTDPDADAFSKLAAMQDWVIAWDSHVPSDSSGNGRRLALLRGFADGRIVAVHGADAELVQTKIAPKEIDEWVRVFAAEGTKRNPPGPIESADSATPEPVVQQQAKGDARFGALTPQVIPSLIVNALTVVHEGAHYDLMSFQPNAPNIRVSPVLRLHRVAEFSDDVRQRLMQLVCRARLGGFDECLAFANAQLRARYPDTPVELKASDIHQLYSLREDVIEVIFRYGGKGSNVMLPVGEFIVRRDSEDNWSVVSGMYFPDESTSKRWSGGPNQSIQDDSKGHEDSAGVETWRRGPYGFLTVRNSVSLEDAVAAFNRMAAANEIGKTQEPLTTKEVIAAMRAWIDRKECSEETRTTFQQIIESNMFRPGDQLSFASRRISEGHVFDLWEVNLVAAKDSTAWFKIRDVVLDSRPKTPQEMSLWNDYKGAMAESFRHFKRGTSKYRSQADQAKLRQLSDQVMQSSVAEGPADVIDNTE